MGCRLGHNRQTPPPQNVNVLYWPQNSPLPPAPWQRNVPDRLVFGAAVHSSFSAVVVEFQLVSVVAFLLAFVVVCFRVVAVWVLAVLYVHTGV